MELRSTTRTEPEFRLAMPGRAENVALVRQALRGAIEVLGVDEARLLDINASVSEACNNVVVHAYEGTEGPMEVHLRVKDTELEVIVSDEGVGFKPHAPEPELEIQGLGLSLIQTLTDRVEFLGGVEIGTRVRMAFALDGEPAETWAQTPKTELDIERPPGELIVAVSAGPLAAPVLGRLIAMLAARAEFSLEGISEAQFVTDAVAAYAPGMVLHDMIQVGIERAHGQLVVRIGPLEEGGANRMVQASAVDDFPPVLERLTEQNRVESFEGGELLSLTLANPH